MTAVAERARPATEPSARGLRYAVGLDGLRAIAVTAVLLFHADVSWLPGGFLGVDVFFVLSGYLITSLLLKEMRATGRLRFGRFYLARARRLLPALLLTLVGAAILALTVAPDAAERLRTDILASLFYVSNWWYVVDGLSYFEAIGRPPLLQHLWTLAIEEQFYLIWPMTALLLFRWGGRLRVASVALLGSLASTAWMAYLSVSMDAPGSVDPSRIFFRTDAHAMGMLLGASFAAVWQMDRLPQRIGRSARRILSVIGIVGLVAIAWFVHEVRYDTVWLYRGGYLALSLAVVLVIAAAVHPALAFGRVLGWGPMRYLGTRSYGLYLYHWPIFMVLRPEIDVPWDGLPVLVLRLAVTVAVAELSYRFVEMPVRRGALGRLWHGTRARWGRQAWGVAAAAILSAGLLVGFLYSGLASAKSVDQLDGLTEASTAGAGDLRSQQTFPQPTQSAHQSAKPSPATGSDGAHVTGSPAPSTGAQPPSADLADGPITAIGDSVLLGDSRYLQAALPEVTVDAAVGRQWGAVYSRIRARLAADRLAPTVIIHTGTNGTIVADQLENALRLIGPDRVVVLVNTHVPRSWQDGNNAILAAAASRHPNVRLVDWNALSNGKRSWFAPDYVHMNKVGGKVFAAAVARALGADPATTQQRLAAVDD